MITAPAMIKANPPASANTAHDRLFLSSFTMKSSRLVPERVYRPLGRVGCLQAPAASMTSSPALLYRLMTRRFSPLGLPRAPQCLPLCHDSSLNVRHFHAEMCAPRKRASGAPPDRTHTGAETHSKVARVEVRSITTPWVRSVTGALSQPGARASLAHGQATSRTWRRRPIR